jgi:hypothetical protein
MVYKRHPLILIDRYDHKNRGRDADQGVGSKSGGAAMKSALKTYQRADNERARHSADDDQIIVSHGGGPSFASIMAYLKSQVISRKETTRRAKQAGAGNSGFRPSWPVLTRNRAIRFWR